MESKTKISHSYLPMTGKEFKEKQKITNAFEKQFWAHNVTHTPSLVRSQFFSLMEEAHEILARIRVSQGLTHLPASGNACNYLLQLTEQPKPTEEFKRELIHQGLKDTKGYFSNLTSEQIDKFISNHSEFLKTESDKKERERKDKISHLHETWDKASSLMDEIFKRNQLEESLTDLFAENVQTHEPFIAEIADKLQNLTNALTNLKDIKRKRLENETTNQQDKKKKKKKKNKKKSSLFNESPKEDKKSENLSSPSSDPKQEQQEQQPQEQSKEQIAENVEPSFSKTETTETNQNNENTETQKPTEEDPQQENQQQQEDENQKKIDEDFIVTVKKVGESVVKVKQELLNVDNIAELEILSHNPTLQDKEKLKEVRKSVLKAQETLMKHLLELDQLVGSSEKVRPFRKAQVQEIQHALTQVDEIGHKLKKVETEIRHQEQEQQFKEEQERKLREEEEKKKLQQLEQQQKIQQLEELKKKQQEEELKAKKLEEELKFKREQEKNFHKHNLQKFGAEEDEEDEEDEGDSSSQESEQSKQRRLKQESENQKQIQQQLQQQKAQHQKSQRTVNNFPVPSKEEWMTLKYDPNFEINRLNNKYQIQALIPNLSLEDLSVEERENSLTISGVRIPSEKEEQILIQKVINFLRVYPRVAQNWSTKDFLVAVLKVGSGSFGQFSKTYELPFDYDRNQKISASYQRGILSVDVPRVIEKKKANPPPSYGFPFGNPSVFGRNPNIYPGNLFW